MHCISLILLYFIVFLLQFLIPATIFFYLFLYEANILYSNYLQVNRL